MMHNYVYFCNKTSKNINVWNKSKQYQQHNNKIKIKNGKNKKDNKRKEKRNKVKRKQDISKEIILLERGNKDIKQNQKKWKKIRAKYKNKSINTRTFNRLMFTSRAGTVIETSGFPLSLYYYHGYCITVFHYSNRHKKFNIIIN